MDGHELAEVVGAFGLFAFITTVITVIIMQVGATLRARAALTREDGYRRLAEDGAAAQQTIARRLTDMEKRMESLETILRTVE
ncbi:hypothetical protein [Actinomadura macrotermitis]|uniref:Secreted protein n=1 Tax=Actinomadura macrotermitis TaxID=2585200 RepID=A0A7K0BYS3_9ACTN|nr:hypothetical protein [Actinomadura macrotermitis]MQY06327.1 hypothetical protein [Actinomadura macrotermitis]